MNRTIIKALAYCTLSIFSIAACKETSSSETSGSKTEIQEEEDTTRAILQEEAVKNITTEEIKGYTLRNNTELPDSVECFVFSNQKQFDQYFHGSKNAPKIDFDKFRLAAIVHSKSRFKTEIKLGEVIQTGTQATVNFTVEKDSKQTQPSLSCLLFAFPNSDDLQSIAFLQSGQTIYNYYFADAD